MMAIRTGASIGLVTTAVVAAWWLAGMYPASVRHDNPAETAARAMTVLWLARAVVLAVFASRVGVLLEPRRALFATAALVSVSWPLLVLLWAAGAMSTIVLLGAEAVLLFLAMLGVAWGRILSWTLGPQDVAVLVATAAGTCGAALLLVFRGHYLPWIS
jgi:hypothetical protein